MPLIELRRSVVACAVALSRSTGREARLIRVVVLFPDIGRRFHAVEFGFLRYSGEKSFVVPEATELELSLQPGLTISL